MRIAWLISACLLASAVEAHAQQQDLPLPPESRIGIVYESTIGRSSEQDFELRALVADHAIAALQRYGYEVVPRESVLTMLLDSGVNCKNGVQECEPAVVLEALGFDAVVMVAIWKTAEGVDAAVDVTSPRARGRAAGRLDGDAERVVPALVTEALADLEKGRAVTLRIHTLPRGAQVTLDGRILGASPVETSAAPGHHEVTLERPGYLTVSTEFEIPRGADDYTVRESMEALTPTGSAAVVESEAPVVDYVVGGTLAAVSVPLIVAPLMSASGGCEGGVDSSGECDQRRFGTKAGIMLAGGVVALGLGAYFLVATPISASLSTDGDLVHATIHGTF